MRISFQKEAFSMAFGLIVPFLGFSQSSSSGFTVEMFIDADPGYGNGTLYQTAVDENVLTLPLDGVAPGAHFISARVCDGIGNWSPTITNPLYISDERLYSALEYFIDTDPGAGNGVGIDGGGSRTVRFGVNTDGLTLGSHTLGVRVQSISGSWTDVMTRTFIITAQEVRADNVIEYFFDADPGVGNGVQLAAALGTNVYFVPTGMLNPGAHLISVRCRDEEGLWSTTVTNPLYVADPVDVVSAEYYVDSDPGVGSGVAVAIPGDGNVSFAVPTDTLKVGEHRLVLRGQTAAGNTVTIFEAPFKVDEAGGVSSVSWILDVDVYRAGSQLSVKAKNVAGGSVVSIFDMNGVCVKNDRLGDGNETVTYDTTGQPGPYIVVVTEPGGRRYIRRVL